MKHQKTTENHYVKRETMLLVAITTLAIGFVTGVIVGVYKTHRTMPGGMGPQDGQSVQNEQQMAKLNAEIQTLEEMVEKHPENLESWIKLGHLYFDTHQPEKAIAAYQKALEIDPGNADIWTDMGVMYRRGGNPEKAVESFNKAISINPKHEIARFNKGVVLLHDLNDTKGALDSWKELLAINPAARSANGEPLSMLVRQIEKNMEKKSDS